MAKREAPEINAGSMADIAFLLLIFFLVTTTMDKDMAYLRKIPKKVEVKDPDPVEKKNIYKITINSKQQIQARDSIIGPEEIESLNGRIKHFYTVNRGKKTGRNLDYPYYSFGTKDMYMQKWTEANIRLENYEKQDPDSDKNLDKYIEQALNEIAEWEKKMKIIETYTAHSGKLEIPEIALQAHIRLESFLDTDYSGYIAIQSEVEKAITELRDEESNDLFGITYSAMRTYYQQNILEDKPRVREYREKMDLIELLFPLRLIEVKPKR